MGRSWPHHGAGGPCSHPWASARWRTSARDSAIAVMVAATAVSPWHGPRHRCVLLLALPVLAIQALVVVGATVRSLRQPPSPQQDAHLWTDYPPSASAAEPAADPAVVTPATVRLAIMSAARQDRGLWDDFDLDHDGTVSQLEVVACVAKRPRWLRTHFPELFAAIDTDHDGDISFAELQALRNSAPTRLYSPSASASRAWSGRTPPEPSGQAGPPQGRGSRSDLAGPPPRPRSCTSRPTSPATTWSVANTSP